MLYPDKFKDLDLNHMIKDFHSIFLLFDITKNQINVALFHPDTFADLDMKKEIKEYYSKFNNYTLTNDEAGRILEHLPPA